MNDTDMECPFCEGLGEVQGQGSYADFEPPIKKCSECNGTDRIPLKYPDNPEE